MYKELSVTSSNFRALAEISPTPSGERRISYKSFIHRSAIHGDDISFFQLAVAGYTVNQFLVDTGADAGRVRIRSGIILEG